jgi:hypothetical protein
VSDGVWQRFGGGDLNLDAFSKTFFDAIAHGYP